MDIKITAEQLIVDYLKKYLPPTYYVWTEINPRDTTYSELIIEPYGSEERLVGWIRNGYFTAWSHWNIKPDYQDLHMSNPKFFEYMLSMVKYELGYNHKYQRRIFYPIAQRSVVS